MMCREVPVQRFNRSLLLAAFCCVAPSVSALAGTLPAPTITSIVIDSPRVEVSWNLVEGATRYEVQARQGEDGRWQSWAFVGAKHNSATITGFAPSTQYYVRVRASNLSESSEFSPPAPLSVGQILRPPSVPTNLRLIELAYKNVVIGWDAPEFAAGYAITIREASSDSRRAVGP